MSAGVWFWLIYVIAFLFCGMFYYPFAEDTRRHAGVSLIVFVLIGLLGWGIFGPPIH